MKQKGHQKNSESARSINEMGGGIEENAVGGHSRSTQLAQVMKDLMEIFLGLNQDKGSEAYFNPQLPAILMKISQTSEQNNLVILSSLAQNLL